MKKTTIFLPMATLLTFTLTLGCSRPDTEGPAIDELFGVFEVLDSLELTNLSPDFSIGETVGFSCEFSKPVDWTLSIVGMETGSTKTLQGFSRELLPEQEVWFGNCDDVPFFGAEPCQVVLSIEGEGQELTADLVVEGTKVYDGIEVASFDDGIPSGALVWHQDGGNMTFELAQDEALQGGQYFKMGGRVNWDWSLGYIDIPLDMSAVGVGPDDFYLNLGVLGGLNGEFATDQYVNILLSESEAPFDDNPSNNASDIFGGDMEVYKYQIRPVDWEGWRFFDISYSDFEVKSEGGNNLREPSQIRGIRLGLQACPFNSGNCPDNGNIAARADIDYVTFTEGIPLLEQE